MTRLGSAASSAAGPGPRVRLCSSCPRCTQALPSSCCSEEAAEVSSTSCLREPWQAGTRAPLSSASWPRWRGAEQCGSELRWAGALGPSTARGGQGAPALRCSHLCRTAAGSSLQAERACPCLPPRRSPAAGHGADIGSPLDRLHAHRPRCHAGCGGAATPPAGDRCCWVCAGVEVSSGFCTPCLLCDVHEVCLGLFKLLGSLSSLWDESLINVEPCR